MPRRTRDWLRQARRNLLSAEVNMQAKLYEETCFESHQAAEKALKALLQSIGVERRGHSLLYLLREARARRITVPKNITRCALILDKHYIPSRYPDVYDEGAPLDYYSREDGEECLNCARSIIEWVEEIVKRYMQEV